VVEREVEVGCVHCLPVQGETFEQHEFFGEKLCTQSCTCPSKHDFPNTTITAQRRARDKEKEYRDHPEIDLHSIIKVFIEPQQQWTHWTEMNDPQRERMGFFFSFFHLNAVSKIEDSH
jgi:hypothetical protein